MMDAREAMERLNGEAGKLHIWLRTQANAPAQRPWFRDTGLEVGGALTPGTPALASGCPGDRRSNSPSANSFC